MKVKIEEIEDYYSNYRLRTQPCPVCATLMGDMPGTRDAYCRSCGYKDPCCDFFI